MAPVAGATALRAAPIIGSALNTPIAGLSGATVGNAIGAGFATDAIVNRLPQVPGQISRGEYADAAANVATGALDLYGAGMLRPIYRGPKSINRNYATSDLKPKKYETDFGEPAPETGYVSGSYRPDYAAPGQSQILPPSFITWSNEAGGMTAAAPRNTFKKFTNRSGLTKEEALARAADKDKDALSKMTEEEFQHTVLKPTGEIVPYHQESLMPQFTGKNNILPITEKEYVEQFNSNLDLLNDIVSKRNKSGVEYKITGLTEDGRLMFETPKQTVAKKLSEKQQKHWDAYTKDADKYATERLKLREGKDGKWKFETDETDLPESFNSREDAMKFLKEEITSALGPREISGTNSWGVGVKPGQWRGEVEDIANTDYFRSLPGLEMRNTTSSVFSDSTPRIGTGAYEYINDYLKKLDLGRVKPGFNSQTEFSRGAWENFIKSGRGVGFYGNPSTIYGTMKTILPPAAIVGAAAMQEKKQMGGYIRGGLKNRVLYNKAKYKR
jgi:hypothetical protein